MTRIFYFLILLIPAENLTVHNSIPRDFSETSEYNCASRSNWGLEDSIPPKRAHHELIYDEARKTILLTCGSTPLDGGNSFDVYNDLWSFNGKSWKKLGNAGDQRSGIRMAFDTKRNKLYSFGGFRDNKCLGDLRVMENGNWKTIATDPMMRASEPGFVYDSKRDFFLAFGGSAERGVVNNITWIWKDGIWKKFNGPGPAGRQAFAMIFDNKRNKTVLFGGMGASPEQSFKDTWEFDGSTWTKVDSAGPERISPGYAFDEKRGMLVVFGGMNSKGRLGDTWGWDGKQWKQLATTGPPARAMGYMAYDKSRDRAVLFGGRISWPIDAQDTWEWDGNEWKEIK